MVTRARRWQRRTQPRVSLRPCTMPVRYYLRQEPGAVIPLAGICAGGGRVNGIPTAIDHEKVRGGHA